MLDVLDNRERVIIEDYFGLSGNTRTLEDIGGDFSLTKERVRQIKEKALRKLRNETGSLFDYL
jgi:RNA polymerase primary sigma factor